MFISQELYNNANLRQQTVGHLRNTQWYGVKDNVKSYNPSQ